MKETVLIDSGPWIEFFGEGELLDKAKSHIINANQQTHITPAIVVFEVYKKLKRERGDEIATRAIGYISEYTSIIQLNREIALLAADTSLEKKLAMADSIVKATADLKGAKIVTTDADFEGMENVILIK